MLKSLTQSSPPPKAGAFVINLRFLSSELQAFTSIFGWAIRTFATSALLVRARGTSEFTVKWIWFGSAPANPTGLLASVDPTYYEIELSWSPPHGVPSYPFLVLFTVVVMYRRKLPEPLVTSEANFQPQFTPCAWSQMSPRVLERPALPS